jgi:hypothetical protein
MPYKSAYQLSPTLPVLEDVGTQRLIHSRYVACMVHILVAIWSALNSEEIYPVNHFHTHTHTHTHTRARARAIYE